MIKSALPVLGGLATFTLALFAMMALGNVLLGAEPDWISRSTATQLVWLAWNVVAMIGGGYVATWIAPRAGSTHAVGMGAIQTVFTLVAMLTTASNDTPPWLWIAGMVTTIPAAWTGSRWRALRR
jgi:hypothetical protein